MNTPTEIPKAQHPYAKRLEATLQTQRNMLALLTRKSQLVAEQVELLKIKRGKFGYTLTSIEELSLTEHQIEIIRTEGEIKSLQKVITEKENYFRNYMVQFEKDEADMLKHWNHTVAIAKKSTKSNVQKLLSQVMWDRVEQDIENKIALYKQLKKHV